MHREVSLRTPAGSSSPSRPTRWETRWSAQGNMLASPDVCHAVAQGFVRMKGDLAERLLAGLEAGERAGGDACGRQAAALLTPPPLDEGP